MLNGVILKLSSYGCQYDSIIPLDFGYVNTEARSFPPYKARDVVSLGFLCRNIHLIHIFFPQPALLIAERFGLVFLFLSPPSLSCFPSSLPSRRCVCDGDSEGREINRLFGLPFLPRQP